jgi:D-alanyl-lipoteichoic acid acyltransferase DltB (MBOAT superfamily)
LITFLLVSLAWIFFTAESVGQALQILRSIFTLDGFAARHAWAFVDGSLGLNTPDFRMMACMLTFYLVVEIAQGKHDLLALLNRQPI